MDLFIGDVTFKEKNKIMVFIFGLIITNIKDNSSMIRYMEMERWCIKMEILILESSNKEKKMGKVNS